jgi:aerobic-type carbon monoxide dehydrogenase small subunit (CoxS/CutS family)
MRFELNGTPVEIPSSMAGDRLLWLLRDHFALNGPKYGCGSGVCGACVVLVDGEPQRACLMAAADADGRKVVTLEGLGAGHADGLHPVQRAWIEASVPQCGYCQNGQVMTAAALLAASPGAGEDAIAAAMDDVVCRCGTQTRIRAAIALAQDKLREGA